MALKAPTQAVWEGFGGSFGEKIGVFGVFLKIIFRYVWWEWWFRPKIAHLSEFVGSHDVKVSGKALKGPLSPKTCPNPTLSKTIQISPSPAQISTPQSSVERCRIELKIYQ